MSGHLNFRNDRDVQGLCVGHHVANIILRVKSAIAPVRAVGRSRIFFEPKTHAIAPRANRGQLGIFFNFNAPAVIVHQMPVKRIDLVPRHGGKQSFNFVLGKKMAAHIEHQPAPRKAGCVGYFHTGDLPIEVFYGGG